MTGKRRKKVFVVNTDDNYEYLDSVVNTYIRNKSDYVKSVRWPSQDGRSIAYQLENAEPQLVLLLKKLPYVSVYSSDIPEKDIKRFDPAIAFGAIYYNGRNASSQHPECSTLEQRKSLAERLKNENEL